MLRRLTPEFGLAKILNALSGAVLSMLWALALLSHGTSLHGQAGTLDDRWVVEINGQIARPEASGRVVVDNIVAADFMGTTLPNGTILPDGFSDDCFRLVAPSWTDRQGRTRTPSPFAYNKARRSRFQP